MREGDFSLLRAGPRRLAWTPRRHPARRFQGKASTSWGIATVVVPVTATQALAHVSVPPARVTGVSSWGTGNPGENDHGPVGVRVPTRFSYSRRALRWAGTDGASGPPSSGWQRARSRWCTAGTAVTRRV